MKPCHNEVGVWDLQPLHELYVAIRWLLSITRNILQRGEIVTYGAMKRPVMIMKHDLHIIW